MHQRLLIFASLALAGSTFAQTGSPATLGNPLGGGVPGKGQSIGGIGGSSSPGVSPYLNLFRGGTSTAVNYYGIVRPQMSLQSSIQSLQQQQSLMGGADETGSGLSNGIVVGTRVRFLNTQPYFLNLSGSAQGSQGGGFSLGGASGTGGTRGSGALSNTVGGSGSGRRGGGGSNPATGPASPASPKN